jgi:UDP-2-acetamido-3-amino-2,3-dideoxy-glucuronate N-acetyltransferase
MIGLHDVFVHPYALCESSTVGEGTRIWAFAHILPAARIGKGCNICDGVFVENDVSVGDNVTVKCGVQLWDGVSLEDDVFVGPNASFANDRFPRSKVYPESFLKTVVRKGASIGANATILPGVEIGPGAMIGAGAVVTRNVPPNAIIVGNPGRITGYVQTGSAPALPASVVTSDEPDSPRVQPLGVGGASLHRLKVVADMRGSLTVGEFEREIPFTPKRYFVVFDVPTREVRGEHAHRQCNQFFVCLKGTVGLLLDDGNSRRELTLDGPGAGVFMPAMIWGAQYRYSSDAVLLVFASHFYDASDYIRTYDEFIAIVGNANKC